MRYINYVLLLVLSIICLSILLVNSNLHIVACDVGQGDAILVTYKNIQILTDGGPDNKVLSCLGKYMPVYDREIELVILTHPQADHYTGLIEILRRYKIDNFLYNKGGSSNQSYQVLEKEVGSSGTNVIIPSEGMGLRVGLIYLDILVPQDEQGIVYLLKFKDFKALFTADYEKEINLTEVVNYIKVSHHGSKNGLTQKLLESIVPKGSLPRSVIGVISVGKNNKYGHPDDEIIKILNDKKINIRRTDLEGNVDYIVR